MILDPQELRNTLQNKPVVEIHVLEPQLQIVVFLVSPVLLLQTVKADVLHQLSTLKQKRPVCDVHVLEPQ